MDRGVSLTLSSAARLERAEDRGALFKHAVARSAVLFVIGVALGLLLIPGPTFPFFKFEHYLHYTGTLQRIAVCYLSAAAIFSGLAGAACSHGSSA
jgi:predicted acyltransferase